MIRSILVFICFIGFFTGNCFTQQTVISGSKKAHILFQESETQQFGFDSFQFDEWSDHYDTLQTIYLDKYRIFYKSVAFSMPDDIDAKILNINDFNRDSLVFKIKNRRVNFAVKNDSIVTLFLPKMKADYSVIAFYKKKNLGELKVVVYPLKSHKIVIVPLTNDYFNKDS